MRGTSVTDVRRPPVGGLAFHSCETTLPVLPSGDVMAGLTGPQTTKTPTILVDRGGQGCTRVAGPPSRRPRKAAHIQSLAVANQRSCLSRLLLFAVSYRPVCACQANRRDFVCIQQGQVVLK